MEPLDYWQIKHQKYATTKWINKPTIFAKQIIKILPKNTKLIDLGAGQGQDSRFFADNNFQVTSTDLTTKALEISKSKHLDQNIEYKVVDLSQELPFKNSSYDIVYSHLALQFFDEETTKKLFDEIYRILKKGGIFAAFVNTINDPEVARSEKIEEEYFLCPVGIKKRFFSIEYFRQLIGNKYQIKILDENGETYKDSIKNLIRFVGTKS
jgi:ubiquinone/menaquinone biosynthesis C-methylase UbiE